MSLESAPRAAGSSRPIALVVPDTAELDSQAQPSETSSERLGESVAFAEVGDAAPAPAFRQAVFGEYKSYCWAAELAIDSELAELPESRVGGSGEALLVFAISVAYLAAASADFRHEYSGVDSANLTTYAA